VENEIIPMNCLQKGKVEGAKPLQQLPSPSPLKERGIQGVRMINNFK